ncbi:hypothetical protein H8E52_00685 [bacterium]|nr:hypothetical protein [bacterium]
MIAILACMIPTMSIALTPYSQDFESLVQSDLDALSNDGWLVYGNVFGYDWAWWYGYGAFPAPNDGAAFSAIASGEGGAEQGAQQLVVFSDYNNGNHVDAWIESNVFQEQVVATEDIGEVWIFDFQAKLGNIEGTSTAAAFIKTLDPSNGWVTTNFLTVDMTSIPDTWADYSLFLAIDPSLDGQIFQFGFMNVATNYAGSGIFYDNINFYDEGDVGTEETSWSTVKSLF